MRTAVVQFDVDEMIVIMLEAMSGEPRPKETSAREMMEQMDEETRDMWYRAMYALKEYWDQQMGNASPLQ
jgi:hypothetical protein